MSTLTETAYYTRRALLWGGILLTGFIILKISLTMAKNVWLSLHPPPPPPPTVAFGKLPALEFPDKPPASASSSLNFKLETINGGLPSLPVVGKVYFMLVGKSNLLALDRAKAKAQKMGFKNEPELIDGADYRWTTSGTPIKSLEMNINTEAFHFFYPYETDQELLVNKNLPTNQQALQEAQNFLRTNNLLSDDLASGKTKFNYQRLTPSGLIPAISLSEADFVQLNLFRADLDEQKILPPDPNQALVSLLFSGAKDLGKRIIKIDYTYFPIEKETFATYPFRPVSQAWQELQSGQAYIATQGQNNQNTIVIRRVSLAYYESTLPQNYLQPIYVFEGDLGFFAYSPAIEPQWRE